MEEIKEDISNFSLASATVCTDGLLGEENSRWNQTGISLLVLSLVMHTNIVYIIYHRQSP